MLNYVHNDKKFLFRNKTITVRNRSNSRRSTYRGLVAIALRAFGVRQRAGNQFTAPYIPVTSSAMQTYGKPVGQYWIRSATSCSSGPRSR